MYTYIFFIYLQRTQVKTFIFFNRYDFYLVSQNVRDGTISPTSYNVIEDTTGMHPDRVINLSGIIDIELSK